MFICKNCGHSMFVAHQVCYHNVLVNGAKFFQADRGVYESEKVYGPYQCDLCGKEYEDLPES